MARTLAGNLDGHGLSIAIVVARFNQIFTERLLAGAQDGLERHGVSPDNIDVVWVPGSFELPLAARWLAESGRYNAVICLGAVIRGETDHYEHVAGAASSGILRSAMETGVPVIFGVLTTDTIEQAMNRAGAKLGNNGYNAALTAIEMASLRRQISAMRPD